MAYTPGPNFLLSLFRQSLNTFIHSSGDYPLLARAHRLLQEEPGQANSPVLLIPITVGIALHLLIQYVVGHVMMSVLILETANTQAHSHELGGGKRTPSCQRLIRTLSSLYSKGGLRLLFSGFGAACSYWAAQSCVTKLLSSLVLPYKSLQPLAYITSSVLLAETHFFWSARTILIREDQINNVSRHRNWRRWKSLAVPALIHAATETFMNHSPAIIEDLTSTPQEHVTVAIKSNIIMSDILVSAFMLVLHVLLLLPSYIVLISVEASFLPQTCETIVLSSSSQRARCVRELFPTAELPLQAQKAWQMVGTGRLLWCLELHVKMCFCLLSITAIVHSLVRYLL
ncbi:hypothetical protein BDV23DRAFT_145235 [Aspergillus alliaceus]|uniref:Uncharacterized protein n=1 Tax=Petromyces alliaceus TaxID=209559 RepID=A0A5N7CN43_PETAA|nr:hypothetical protein BDV23DRAFT_145235 [Aspergillus alliaceus]